jgi:SAM-dependent methyltransferase
MAAEGARLAVDIGSGMGFTTYGVFGESPTVCIDVEAANLRWCRERVAAVPGARRPLCVVGLATGLPLKAGVARYVLCSEVLEHLDDDAGDVSEIARVLAPGERAVVTVPIPDSASQASSNLAHRERPHPGRRGPLRPSASGSGRAGKAGERHRPRARSDAQRRPSGRGAIFRSS